MGLNFSSLAENKRFPANPYLCVLVYLLVFIGWLTGCAMMGVDPSTTSPNSSTPPGVFQASNTSGLIEALGPGDVFELKVFGEEDLSGKFRVSGSGEVTLPLIGRMSVGDVGLTDLEAQITKVEGSPLKQPQVNIFVEGFKGRKVYVFGRVMKSGTMGYENGMSLIEDLLPKRADFTISPHPRKPRLLEWWMGKSQIDHFA